MGRQVQVLPVQSDAAQIEAMGAGQLHSADFTTGTTPLAIVCAPLVPLVETFTCAKATISLRLLRAARQAINGIASRGRDAAPIADSVLNRNMGRGVERRRTFRPMFSTTDRFATTADGVVLNIQPGCRRSPQRPFCALRGRARPGRRSSPVPSPGTPSCLSRARTVVRNVDRASGVSLPIRFADRGGGGRGLRLRASIGRLARGTVSMLLT